MLKNILVVSSSGLVLFSKEYETSVSQPRLIGSLLTAIAEFSKNVAGMPVSYIQLKGVAVTIVATFDISCAIFHSADDGPEFGKLIATQILSTFFSTYSKDLKNNIGTNLKDFEDFQCMKIKSDHSRRINYKLMLANSNCFVSRVHFKVWEEE